MKKKYSGDGHDRKLEATRVWRANSRIVDPHWWAKRAIKNLRFQASKRHIPFNLDWTDLQVPKRCPVLNTEFIFSSTKNHPQNPSVDRIRPVLGYVKGNVRVISFRANRIKSDATLEELEAVVTYLKE